MAEAEPSKEKNLEELRVRAQNMLTAKFCNSQMTPERVEELRMRAQQTLTAKVREGKVPLSSSRIEELRLKAQATLSAKVAQGSTANGKVVGSLADQALRSDTIGMHLAEELFKIIDTDDSGGIDWEEMQRAAKIIQDNVAEYYSKDEPIPFPDRDKDGKVDFDEWICYMSSLYDKYGAKNFASLGVTFSYALRTAFFKGGAVTDIQKLAEDFFEVFAEELANEGRVLNESKFPIALRTMGMEFDKGKITTIWKESGGNGFVDLIGFTKIVAKYYEPKEQTETVANLYDAFGCFDLDGDGYVTLEEMRSVMMECGSTPLTQEEWATYEAFFKRADVNGNNKLTVCEYIKASLADEI